MQESPGGADIILIPEIPYDIDKVVGSHRQKNRDTASGFTILAVAEGAISKEDAQLGKKELKKKMEEDRKLYPSVSYEVAEEIEDRTGMEIRVSRFRDIPREVEARVRTTVYCLPDLESAAAKLILNDEYGYMVGH